MRKSSPDISHLMGMKFKILEGNYLSLRPPTRSDDRKRVVIARLFIGAHRIGILGYGAREFGWFVESGILGISGYGSMDWASAGDAIGGVVEHIRSSWNFPESERSIPVRQKASPSPEQSTLQHKTRATWLETTIESCGRPVLEHTLVTENHHVLGRVIPSDGTLEVWHWVADLYPLGVPIMGQNFATPAVSIPHAMAQMQGWIEGKVKGLSVE